MGKGKGFNTKVVSRVQQDIYPLSSHLTSNPTNKGNQKVEPRCLMVTCSPVAMLY